MVPLVPVPCSVPREYSHPPASSGPRASPSPRPPTRCHLVDHDPAQMRPESRRRRGAELVSQKAVAQSRRGCSAADRHGRLEPRTERRSEHSYIYIYIYIYGVLGVHGGVLGVLSGYSEYSLRYSGGASKALKGAHCSQGSTQGVLRGTHRATGSRSAPRTTAATAQPAAPQFPPRSFREGSGRLEKFSEVSGSFRKV